MKKRLLTILMSAALVASVVAPSFVVKAADVDDGFAGDASLFITHSDGVDFNGLSGNLDSIVENGYIYLRTDVSIEANNPPSGTEILEISNMTNIESVEYRTKNSTVWNDAMGFIVNTNHTYTNKYNIKRYYRIKISGDVNFYIQYKVYTPVGVMDYASFPRCIVVQGNDSSTWFERPQQDPEDIQYRVQDYSGESSYPTKDGKLFAGWYTDKTYSTPYLESTGAAYAKFVDENVLGTRFQWKTDRTAVRFVSSVDSLNYDHVGFKFSGTYGNKTIEEKEKSVTKVYNTINAAGQEVYPTILSDDSAYFFTYTIRNMDANTGSTWSVTPYYVTLDGKKVYGATRTYPDTQQ